jgi:hypothetical protein
MTVEFSRNVASFPINRYSELRPVNALFGYFLTVDPLQGMRTPFADGRNFAWPGGALRPSGTDNLSQFLLQTYQTQRFAYPVLLDDRAVNAATWDVTGVEQRKLGQQMMTHRTFNAAAALNAASWGNNTIAVTSIAGVTGTWGAGTTTVPNIQISLQFAYIAIEKATGGVVQPQDLVLVLSSDSATTMSQSQEVRSYLGNSIYSYPVLTGQLPGFEPRSRQKNRGLPPELYDCPLVVENTVVTTSNKNATSLVQQYAIPKGTAYLLARAENAFIHPLQLAAEAKGEKLTREQIEAVPIYSTLVGFFKEEMTTETRVDPYNRINQMSIATDFNYVVSNPISGYQFTGCFS